MNVNDRVELGCSMYGKSTIGVSILESVLLKVCEMEGAVTINGVLLQDTPGYKKLCSKEDAILGMLKKIASKK